MSERPDPEALGREIARVNPLREPERFDRLFERYLDALAPSRARELA